MFGWKICTTRTYGDGYWDFGLSLVPDQAVLLFGKWGVHIYRD